LITAVGFFTLLVCRSAFEVSTQHMIREVATLSLGIFPSYSLFTFHILEGCHHFSQPEVPILPMSFFENLKLTDTNILGKNNNYDERR